MPSSPAAQRSNPHQHRSFARAPVRMAVVVDSTSGRAAAEHRTLDTLPDMGVVRTVVGIRKADGMVVGMAAGTARCNMTELPVEAVAWEIGDRCLSMVEAALPKI